MTRATSVQLLFEIRHDRVIVMSSSPSLAWCSTDLPRSVLSLFLLDLLLHVPPESHVVSFSCPPSSCTHVIPPLPPPSPPPPYFPPSPSCSPLPLRDAVVDEEFLFGDAKLTSREEAELRWVVCG